MARPAAPRDVRTQARLAALGQESWEAFYARAASAGSGELVDPQEERLAATDELLAAALPALMRVGGRLMTAALVAGTSAGAVARETAGVVRVLDRALAAHGRDHGYDVEAWRSAAVSTAWVLADLPEGDGPAALAELIEEVTRAVAGVFIALPRDRLGVAEGLAHAIAHVLVVHAVVAGRR
jgi:hypothetical protein